MASGYLISSRDNHWPMKQGGGFYSFSTRWSSVPNAETNSSELTFYFQRRPSDGEIRRDGDRVSNGNPTIEVYIDNDHYTFKAYPDESTETTDGAYAAFPVEYNGKKSDSFTITVPHNVNGSKSLYVIVNFLFYDECEYFYGYSNYYEEPIYYAFKDDYQFTDDITLDNIPRPAIASCPTSYIGKETTIAISSPSNTFTYTLTYEFGSVSGTIVEKTSLTSIKWLVPTSLYAELTSNKSGTCKLHCTAFNGIDSITTNSTFTIAVSEENAPVLSPIVEELNSNALALTGNKDTLIRYYSSVNFSFNAVAQNMATIASYLLTYGSSKYTTATGQIGNIESGVFTFKATDSRGFTTTKVITKNVIPYFKPTCNIIRESSTPDGNLTVKINGNCFNGSFGLVNNALTLKYRYKVSGGTYSDWVEITASRSTDNTYNATVSFTGLDYKQAYIFQATIADTINTITSAETTIRFLPVFDWSEDDFNFNVPVNINGSDLTMNGETVLKHNIETNDIILSSTGGNIYVRPGGTTDTSSEVRITSQGDIEVKGDIIINGVSLTTILQNAGLM